LGALHHLPETSGTLARTFPGTEAPIPALALHQDPRRPEAILLETQPEVKSRQPPPRGVQPDLERAESWAERGTVAAWQDSAAEVSGRLEVAAAGGWEGAEVVVPSELQRQLSYPEAWTQMVEVTPPPPLHRWKMI